MNIGEFKLLLYNNHPLKAGQYILHFTLQLRTLERYIHFHESHVINAIALVPELDTDFGEYCDEPSSVRNEKLDNLTRSLEDAKDHIRQLEQQHILLVS